MAVSRSPYTLRAYAVGVALAAFLAAGAPYGNMVLRGSYLTQDFSTPGALFLFFVLVAAANACLRLVLPRASLCRAELIVVYSMMLVASAIATCGLSEYLLPIMTAWHYFATPENDWGELFHGYVSGFLVPLDPVAIKHFYEGLPPGAAVPWRVWTAPLAAWSVLVVVIYFVMICLAVILRRQWVEREKLIYPLAQLPLEMVRGADAHRLPPFFRSPVMWLGFAVPALISSVNACHNYLHVVPEVQLSTSLALFRDTVRLPVTITFPVLGFAYLIHLDVALGLWLFNVLVNVQRGIYGLLGISSGAALDQFSVNPSDIAYQEMGALLFLVGYSLWVGRGHLRDVARRALRNDPAVDDTDEILSYRVAVWGGLAGLVFITGWMWLSGIPLGVILLFLAAAFAVFVGMTRIVAESGVPEARTPMMPQSFVVAGVGTSGVGSVGLTSLGFTFVWATELRIVVLTSVAHSLKMIEGFRSARPFVWVLLVAILVSMVSSMAAILELSYRYGGINLNQWFFGGGARAPFETFIARRLTNPAGPDWLGWAHTGLGASVMAGLMLCRHFLGWWPVHPIGFPIAGLWLMSHSWFSIFLAWLIKGAIVKYWGPKGFRAARPFFLGLVLGQFVSAGVWLLIDAATGMTDNRIFSW